MDEEKVADATPIELDASPINFDDVKECVGDYCEIDWEEE